MIEVINTFVKIANYLDMINYSIFALIRMGEAKNS